MTKATYKGHPIERVNFDRKADTYALFGTDDNVVVEMKPHEFRSLPNLRGIRITNGRHRRAASQVYCGPVGKSYFAISPGTVFYSGSTWVSYNFAPERPVEDAGIRAGEIIAQRTWRLFPDYKLHSVHRSEHEWIPGKPMSGDVRHEYGVHAFKNLALAGEYADEYLDPMRVVWMSIGLDENGRLTYKKPLPSIFVFGTVALWGEVVEHERGYRAEFAKIASLDRIAGLKDHEAAQALCRVRARYGVERRDV